MTKYIRNEDTISGRLFDETVMMDINKGKYYYLNTLATRIWDLLEQPKGIEELCNLLMEEYEVDFARCRKETGELLDKMVKEGFILRQGDLGT